MTPYPQVGLLDVYAADVGTGPDRTRRKLVLTVLDTERVYAAEAEARGSIADEGHVDQYEPSPWTRYVLHGADWAEASSTFVFDAVDDDA